MAVVFLISLVFGFCLGPVTFAEEPGQRLCIARVEMISFIILGIFWSTASLSRSTEVDCYNRYNKGIHYAGHISKIPSGRPCLKWSEVNIHPLHYYTEDHNYCRNPLPSHTDSPYCYTTKVFAFEKCIIPVCDCRNSTKDFDYNGNIRITRRGHNCKNNDYCRAPSGHKDSVGGPWCYTGLINPRWDHCNVPICESAKCPDLSGNPNLKPLDGKTAYRYGEIVILTCNTGYKLNGSMSLTCQQSGQWNNTIPQCQVVTCHALRQMPHQKLEPVQIEYSYRDNVTFKCEDGYELSSADTMVTCQGDGTWSNKQPNCTGLLCPPLSKIDNALLPTKLEGHRYPETLKVACVTGYQVEGSDLLHCNSSGLWGLIPQCKAVTCHDLRQMPHQKLEPVQKAYSYRDNVTFKCNDGYELSSGNSMVICQSDGTWSDQQPNCTGIPCLHLPKIDKASLPSQTKQYRYPETIKITCEIGYVVESSDLLQCNSSGFWNYLPQYTCIENSQSHKDSMENRGKCISYGLFGGILAVIVLISAGLQIATCFYYRKRVRKSAAVYENIQFNAVERQRSSNEETYSELT